MLGMTVWLFLFIFLILGTIVFLICFTAFNKNIVSINELIKAIIFILALAIICFPLIEGISASIKIFNDRIILNTFFIPRKIYYKKDIIVSYAIQEHRGRGAYLCPCLVVGNYFQDIICYTRKKFVYDNYFLILLDHKKLKTILSWYNEKIKLPPKDEFCKFMSNGYKSEQKNINKFYDLIATYNENLDNKNEVAEILFN